MPGCAAFGCSNRPEKGFHLFRFPKNAEALQKWVQNMRRADVNKPSDSWKPSPHSKLCSVHFDESQFESNRTDGRMKLKSNAIPTRFNIPNCPAQLSKDRKSVYKKPKNTLPENEEFLSDKEQCINDQEFTFEDYKRVKTENEQLKSEISELKTGLKKFLNDEQIETAVRGHDLFERWGDDSIVKALKFRFALSRHGYEFLRETGYPLPSYSTILRRIRNFQVQYGIFEDILEPLQFKVKMMTPEDRFCAMSIDEMQIDSVEDFDKNKKQFYGNVTLGETGDEGTHVVTVLIRGIKNYWKQVVAAEVTGKTTSPEDIKNLIERSITHVEKFGLHVVSVTNDMGPTNQANWTKVGVKIQKDGVRKNTLNIENKKVCAIADVPHILKNLKCAVMRGNICLPDFFVQKEQLPTKYVYGKYVSALWEAETQAEKPFRTLHHLRRQDIYPDNFQKINVGSAIRFFSTKTAAALETAVELKLLPKDALTTARFIRLIEEWFTIMNSRTRKASITKFNKCRKFAFLEQIIELFQHIVFISGWKPLNKGVILSTLSVMDIVEFLLNNGYDFVLTHRFTQDALENVFSQVRRRSSLTPTALDCIRALKNISLAQFISDVRNTNYSSDSDFFLLDTFNPKDKLAVRVHSTNNDQPNSSSLSTEDKHQLPPDLPTMNFDDYQKSNFHDLNILYNISGSTVNALLKHVCQNCSAFLRVPCTMDWVERMQFYKNALNKGGLKDPSYYILYLILNCETLYNRFRHYLLHNNAYELIRRITEEVCIDIKFPNCCKLKRRIVDHFFTVRCFAVVSLKQCTRSKRKKTMYGTCSAKKSKK